MEVSSLAAAVGTGKENCEKTIVCVFANSKHKNSNFYHQTNTLQTIIYVYKVANRKNVVLVNDGSTVVEHWPQHLKIEVISLAAAVGTGRENC
jgi:hypothetical protein